MISAREIEQKDIEPLLDYWFTAGDDFLTGMGIDLNKMPSKDVYKNILEQQLTQSYPEKQNYCTIWLLDNMAIGHCNVNKIIFGEEAYMHLHVWKKDVRMKGMGSQLVKLSLPFFFENLKLKNLFCEPYALNPAPNKTLPKAGFEFVKEYTCVPGWINFEQPVMRWQIGFEKYIRNRTLSAIY